MQTRGRLNLILIKMQKIISFLIAMALTASVAMAQISHINNGESMATVRVKLNQVIDLANSYGSDSVLIRSVSLNYTLANWSHTGGYLVDSVFLLPALPSGYTYYVLSYRYVLTSGTCTFDTDACSLPSIQFYATDKEASTGGVAVWYFQLANEGLHTAKNNIVMYSAGFCAKTNAAMYASFRNPVEATCTSFINMTGSYSGALVFYYIIIRY